MYQYIQHAYKEYQKLEKSEIMEITFDEDSVVSMETVPSVIFTCRFVYMCYPSSQEIILDLSTEYICSVREVSHTVLFRKMPLLF